jgi:hypothetical protein
VSCVLTIADRLLYSHLHEQCQIALLPTVTGDSLADTLAFADQFHCARLVVAARQFAAENPVVDVPPRLRLMLFEPLERVLQWNIEEAGC